MSEIFATPEKNAEQIIKRAFWLAYKAAARTSGMGWMKARDDATEEDVWQNVKSAGDYPFGPTSSERGEFYGDYVFGRMLKLRLNVLQKNAAIGYPSCDPDVEYQAWAFEYSTYEKLLRAAALELSGATA